MNIGNFVGTWYIQWRAGVEGHGIQEQWTLMIGTGSQYGDRKPFLSADYVVSAGFALLDQEGVVQLSTDPPAAGVPTAPQDQGENEQSLALRVVGEQLCWNGSYKERPLYLYISAAETWMPGGRKSVHLYGSSTYGDPEQMAVWGGSGTPPSTPPPPTPEADV
jgi:hypothetical protein